MRQAVRVIVIRDTQLLVMHRNKFGTEYDTLPGGNIEPGETYEQAAIRELTEETSVTVNNLRPVFVEQAGDPYGVQYVYLADYVSGEPQLAPDSEEAQINTLGKNLYEPRWLALSELSEKPFVSEALKAAILQAVQKGFPASPVQIR